MTDGQKPSLTRPGPAALTDVLPGPDGPLPLLILDQRPEMAVRSGPAERVNLLVSALLGMGLTLVTHDQRSRAGHPGRDRGRRTARPGPGMAA
jgi:hypothetical protein